MMSNGWGNILVKGRKQGNKEKRFVFVFVFALYLLSVSNMHAGMFYAQYIFDEGYCPSQTLYVHLGLMKVNKKYESKHKKIGAQRAFDYEVNGTS